MHPSRHPTPTVHLWTLASTTAWLFCAPAAHAATSQVLNGALPVGGDVAAFKFSPDNTRVLYTADQAADGGVELYSVPVSGGVPVRMSAAMGASNNVVDFYAVADTSNSNTVVYLADQAADEFYELFLNYSYSSTPTKINTQLPAGGDVTAVQVCGPNNVYSTFGQFLVYRADQTSDDVFNLYLYDCVNQNTPTLLATAGGGTRDVTSFQISPDRKWVVYVADTTTDDVFELFRVPLNGGTSVKISTALPAGRNVTSFQISPDSKHVAYLADRTVDEQYELYDAPMDGGPNDKLSGNMVAGGNVTSFQFTPDGRAVVYLADQNVDETFELFSTSLSDATNIKLSGALPAGGDVSAFQVGGDSAQVAYIADQNTDGTNELFSVPVGGGTPIQLNPNLPAGGNVTSLVTTPDGSSVLYLADQNVDERFELFTVPITGGAPLKLNAPLQPNGDVTSVVVQPNSVNAIYRADLSNDEVFEIYRVHLPCRWKSAGGSWDTTTNWQAGLPDATADAIIDIPGVATASGNTSSRVVCSLTLGGGAQTSTLELQSGAAVSTVQGLTLLNGGILAGDGTISTGGQALAVPPGAEISAMAGEQLDLLSGVVTNGGRIEALGNALAAAEINFGTGVTNQNGTGLITGHDATLNFHGGLTNQGSLVLTNGLNDVFGDIANTAGQGRIVVTGGATATFYDDVVNSGSIQVSSAGTLQSAAIFLGGFSGNGISGSGAVFLEGDTRPGFSPGTMSFGGDVSHGPQAVLHVEIAGTTPGTQYDRLAVAGKLTLAGTLDVTFLNGFAPTAGMSFDVWDAASSTGGFDAIHLPTLPAGLFWRTGRLNTEGVLAIGVTPENYADFATYHGLSTPAQGDQEGDGLRNDLEYALGLNPKVPTPSAGLPAVTRNGSNDVISFAMPSLSSPDVQLQIESSTDLVNWAVLASRTGMAAWTGSISLSPAASGYDTVTFVRPALGEIKHFYRLSTHLVP